MSQFVARVTLGQTAAGSAEDARTMHPATPKQETVLMAATLDGKAPDVTKASHF